ITGSPVASSIEPAWLAELTATIQRAEPRWATRKSVTIELAVSAFGPLAAKAPRPPSVGAPTGGVPDAKPFGDCPSGRWPPDPPKDAPPVPATCGPADGSPPLYAVC